MRLLLIFLIPFIFMCSGCGKPPVPEFYYECKVDGKTYMPNSCVNCITCTILRDTIFMLGANRGFESVIVGINDSNKIGVKAYLLNSVKGRQASYDNSPLVDEIYLTDDNRTGKLEITTFDRSNMIIAGTFSFQAFNKIQNRSVNVTVGKFRLRYKTN